MNGVSKSDLGMKMFRQDHETLLNVDFDYGRFYLAWLMGDSEAVTKAKTSSKEISLVFLFSADDANSVYHEIKSKFTEIIEKYGGRKQQQDDISALEPHSKEFVLVATFNNCVSGAEAAGTEIKELLDSIKRRRSNLIDARQVLAPCLYSALWLLAKSNPGTGLMVHKELETKLQQELKGPVALSKPQERQMQPA